MAIYRGAGGSGEGTTNAYANQISSYATTALNKAEEAVQAANTAEEAEQAVTAMRDELEELVEGLNQSFFQSSTAPPTLSLTEGDLWYNPSTTDLLVYRNVDGMLQWTHLILENDSNSSDIMDAGTF